MRIFNFGIFKRHQVNPMSTKALLEEMFNLRSECRFLNAEIINIELKKDRRAKTLENLTQANIELIKEIDSQRKKIKEHVEFDIEDLKSQINEIDKNLSIHHKEYDDICKDIDKLKDALEIQKKSQIRSEMYGQICGGYKHHATKQINKDGCLIALKKSLEEELKALEESNAPYRVIARKRSQLSRIKLISS